MMSVYVRTRAEARAEARRFRSLFADTDMKVEIMSPRFEGDTYRVTVG